MKFRSIIVAVAVFVVSSIHYASAMEPNSEEPSNTISSKKRKIHSSGPESGLVPSEFDFQNESKVTAMTNVVSSSSCSQPTLNIPMALDDNLEPLLSKFRWKKRHKTNLSRQEEPKGPANKNFKFFLHFPKALFLNMIQYLEQEDIPSLASTGKDIHHWLGNWPLQLLYLELKNLGVLQGILASPIGTNANKVIALNLAHIAGGRELLPSVFKGFPNLRRLELLGLGAQDSDFEGIEKLEILEELGIFNNQGELTGEAFPWFLGIRKLNLQHCGIVDENVHLLAPSEHLRSFELYIPNKHEPHKFTGNTLGTLKQLKRLQVSEARDFDPETFDLRENQKLVDLEMSNLGLHEESLPQVLDRIAPTVVRLHLDTDDCDYEFAATDANLLNLPRLANLTELNLMGNIRISFGRPVVESTPHLTNLNLSKTAVTGESLKWIARTLPIVKLDVSHNPQLFEGESLSEFKSPPTKLIDLRFTSVPNSERQKLRARGIKVFRSPLLRNAGFLLSESKMKEILRRLILEIADDTRNRGHQPSSDQLRELNDIAKLLEDLRSDLAQYLLGGAEVENYHQDMFGYKFRTDLERVYNTLVAEQVQHLRGHVTEDQRLLLGDLIRSSMSYFLARVNQTLNVPNRHNPNETKSDVEDEGDAEGGSDHAAADDASNYEETSDAEMQ